MPLVQGIGCDDQATGTITITLPDTTSLLPTISNPNGVVVMIVLKRNYDNFVAVNYDQIFKAAIPKAIAGNFIKLASSTGESFEFKNVPAGSYQISVRYYDDAFVDGASLNVPDIDRYAAVTVIDAAVNLTSCDTNIYGCTDPAAKNTVDDAAVDDGSCLYQGAVGDVRDIQCPCPPDVDGVIKVDRDCCPEEPVFGCTDPNATNYNSAASVDSGDCQYEINSCLSDCEVVNTVIPACIPNEIDELLAYNKDCIIQAGNRVWTKQITGISDACSTMDTWKLLIIDDLMSRKGLPCLFNCTDQNTPAILDASNDCEVDWSSSGGIYWNPSEVGTYNINTIVKRKNLDGSISIYSATSSTDLNIDPISKRLDNPWRKCSSLVITETREEYLPNFLAYVQQYCKDCGIAPYLRGRARKAVKVKNVFTAGGSIITVNGATFKI